MEDMPKSKTQVDKFVKLEGNGDSITGVIVGKPYFFFSHWDGGKSVLCPNTLKCNLCVEQVNQRQRFRVNFVVKENDRLVMKILEQGQKVYGVLQELAKGGYDLSETRVQITRRGKKLQTSYSVIPLPSKDLDLNAIREVKHLELVWKDKDDEPPPQEAPPEPMGEDDVPF